METSVGRDKIGRFLASLTDVRKVYISVNYELQFLNFSWMGLLISHILKLINSLHEAVPQCFFST